MNESDALNRTSNELNYYHSLHKYFINLDNRTDRLEDTRNQVGQDFIRVQAVNGKQLTFEELDTMFDMRKCNKVYNINQTRSQAAATISQYKIFQQVLADSSIKDHDFVLICEDDNTYIKDFKTKLDQLLHFLSQNKFNQANIVILKYLVLEQIVDYFPVLKFYNDKHIHLTESDLASIHANYPQYYDRAKFMSTKSEFYNVMRITNVKKLSWSFTYKQVTPSDQPSMYTDTQTLFSTYVLRPFSSSCFLIRKSLIRKIVNKYKKPWWYADDFKQICPIQDILFASPFFAMDSETGYTSSIASNKVDNNEIYANEFVSSNFHYNRVTKRKHLRLFARLKIFSPLIGLQYSNNQLISALSIFLQKLCFIRPWF